MDVICEEIAGYVVEYENCADGCPEEKHCHTEEEMLAFAIL